MAKMFVYAHRGYSGLYPENTMLAFEKAAEAGADGIELDVHLTRDNEVVVIHDEKIDRTTDGTGYVCDYSLKELQKFDASHAWGGTHPFQHIPTFEEYCEWVAEKPVYTNIELKTGLVFYKGIEQKTIDILSRYGLIGKVMFSSFNHLSLLTAKKIAPEIPVGALVGEKGIVNAGSYCKQYGFEYYHPSYKALSPKAVEEIHGAGIKINAWTINGMQELQMLHDLGCEGEIGNFPEICRHWVDGLS